MNRNDTLHSGLSLLGLAPRNQSVLQNSVDTISLLNGVLCFQTILACESDAKRAYLVSSIIVVIRFHKNLLESAQMRRNARGKARPIRLLRSQHECCENQSSQNSFHRKDSSKNRRTLEHSRTPVSTFLKTTNNTHIYMFTSIVHARIQNNISQSYSYQNPLSIVASDVSLRPSPSSNPRPTPHFPSFRRPCHTAASSDRATRTSASASFHVAATRSATLSLPPVRDPTTHRPHD